MNDIEALLRLSLPPVKHLIFLFCLLGGSFLAQAQLPDISVINVGNRNFVRCKNQYDKLQRIEIQRSNDSSRGYVTIGSVTNPKKGDFTFADERPLLGRSHYQLRIVFNEEMDWYSKRASLTLDSATVAKNAGVSLPPAQVADLRDGKAGPSTPITSQPSYIASSRVFTNSYTGHINIELENTLEKRYSLVFYDYKNNEAVRIDRVGKDRVILDKHNFNGRGVYKFVLKESGVDVESGYVTIQ